MALRVVTERSGERLLRASDDDRERAAERVRVAAAEGRIDLSEAGLTGRVTRIRAFALWGGMGVVVPDDVQVEVKGLALYVLFGRRAVQSGTPGAPRIVISGLAL